MKFKAKRHTVNPAMISGRTLLRGFAVIIVVTITIGVVSLFSTPIESEPVVAESEHVSIPQISCEMMEHSFMYSVAPTLPDVRQVTQEPEIVYTEKQVYAVNSIEIMSEKDSGNVIAKVESSSVLDVKYQDGDEWYQTFYNGGIGYVSSESVKDYDPELHIELGLDYKYQDLTREVIDMLGVTVDEYFFYGMMYTESRFRVLAESYAGAQGIMQIMPSTWTAYYKMFCEEYPEFGETIVDDVTDIRSNITIGIYIIHKTAESYGIKELGNEHKLLTSYNRGSGGASKYYKSNGTYVSDYSTEILRAAEYIREYKTWKEGL